LLKQAVKPTVAGVKITSDATPRYVLGIDSRLTFEAVAQGRYLADSLNGTKVTWSIGAGSGGTMDSATGIFTGATTVGTYTVTATSVEDPTKKATVQLNVAAATVNVASTRYIPAAKAGDTSDWIEIATSEHYSLLVRRDNIPQTAAASASNYTTSPQRTAVNDWFAGDSTMGDSAPLRRFAMKNSAMTYVGVHTSLQTGRCVPAAGTDGATGDDVAFLGSYAEYGLFCSLQNDSGTPPPYTPAVAGAQANFNMLNFAGNGVEPGRSSSDTSRPRYAGSALYSSTYANQDLRGMIGVCVPDIDPAPYYIRPMLWIDNTAAAALFENR
jgi:hypothetical protein